MWTFNCLCVNPLNIKHADLSKHSAIVFSEIDKLSATKFVRIENKNWIWEMATSHFWVHRTKNWNSFSWSKSMTKKMVHAPCVNAKENSKPCVSTALLDLPYWLIHFATKKHHWLSHGKSHWMPNMHVCAIKCSLNIKSFGLIFAYFTVRTLFWFCFGTFSHSYFVAVSMLRRWVETVMGYFFGPFLSQNLFFRQKTTNFCN